MALLLEARAEKTAADTDEITALYCAASHGLLWAGAYQDAINSHGRTALGRYDGFSGNCQTVTCIQQILIGQLCSSWATWKLRRWPMILTGLGALASPLVVQLRLNSRADEGAAQSPCFLMFSLPQFCEIVDSIGFNKDKQKLLDE